eukprot:TRINITY_DN195_c1_g1_i2.p1 TRINITY_DN195_c1_g1~~TRINITY_DN195_c1_g1_i2.p1  ORF type:complete len:112 (-),score=14.20 TRINITY_DN195_c1_g1_i2:118-453(-)
MARTTVENILNLALLLLAPGALARNKIKLHKQTHPHSTASKHIQPHTSKLRASLDTRSNNISMTDNGKRQQSSSELDDYTLREVQQCTTQDGGLTAADAAAASFSSCSSAA